MGLLDWIDRLATRQTVEQRIYCALSFTEWRSGADVMKAAGVMWTGRFYPTIMRMERDGTVESRWKDSAQHPRPRLYRLTHPQAQRSD